VQNARASPHLSLRAGHVHGLGDPEVGFRHECQGSAA
jgi:hypothetical protein